MTLRARLLSSFLLVIFITLGSVVAYAWRAPFMQLQDAPRFFSRQYAWRFTPFFIDAYAQEGSWETAADLVQTLSQPIPAATAEPATIGPAQLIDLHTAFTIQRVLLATAEGRIIADSAGELAAETPLPAILQAYAVPLAHGGQTVGQLVVLSGFDAEFSRLLVVGFRRLVAAVGLLATAVALLMSAPLAQRLARPVQQLRTAAQAIAHGETSAPLPITRTDEIGQLTASFNEMTAALAHQKQLRQQMMADVAHELRTPLSILQLEVEALADGLQAAETAAPTLQTEIRALERLINDLRLLSLADAQELHLELAPLDTADFLAQIANAWRRPAAAQGVHLAWEAQADLPPLLADEGRLYQVMHNLLSNALRYTAAGGTVRLGGGVAGAELLLWVADTGAGIAAEDVPHLFERFYRADKSRRRETGGSGLGLAIAKRLVGLHGGRIWATSELGRGTTLWVALPLDKIV